VRSDARPEFCDTVLAIREAIDRPMKDRLTPLSPAGVRAFWDWLTGIRRKPAAVGHRTLAGAELRSLRKMLRESYEGIGGEIAVQGRLASILGLYAELGDEGREAFMKLLIEDFGADEMAIARAIRTYTATTEPRARRRAESQLRQALASPRVRILRQFNRLPNGVKFLVDLRADVHRYLRQAPELEVIDEELYALFSSWFDVGNLELRRISWQSPAALLEKLIAYEAVHEIRSWSDLRNRMDADRRCYAFFHPRMPEEPLIFVEIALVADMASNVHALLDEAAPRMDPQAAQAAVFYSISNTQPGLRGVSFGDFLIKRVVEQLTSDLPKLKVFATLSPVPGFRKWLEARLKARDASLFGPEEAAKLAHSAGVVDPFDGLALLLEREIDKNGETAATLEPVVTQLAARYLVEEKEEERPIDPVARFHLGNGARLERINWLADTSPRGLRQSVGVMVNYLYKLGDIEANHEAYARKGRVTISDAVKRSLRKLA
jgi:malonyl-CoA decarboxylase